MRKIQPRFIFVPFFLVLMYCLPSPAQVTTGTPPFGTYTAGPDVINLANLNSHLVIPVVHKTGRGTNFNYDLSNDSSVWYPVGSTGSQSWQPVSNFGWRGVTEALTGYISAIESQEPCPPPGTMQTTYEHYVYHNPFGASHLFFGTSSNTCSNPSFSTLNHTAVDGSGYTILATGSVATITSRTGEVFFAPFQSNSGAASVTDQNGNEISLNSSGVFTDTLGITNALTVAGGAPPSPMTFTYVAPSGANAAYTMKYLTHTIKTNFGCSGISEYTGSNVPLVSEIDLPDGTKYTFSYEPTPDFSGDVTGRLASVTLPTGGTISYAYSGGSNGITCVDGSTATLTRTTPDGAWKYAHSESGTEWTTAITDPQNNETTLNFQGLYETERQVHQGATTLLKTVFTCYNGNVTTSTCNTTAITLPITQTSAFLQWKTSGLESRTDTLYNSFGLVTELDEYAYGNNTPGAIVRETKIQYAPLGNGIVSMPSSVTVEDGSGNVKAQTSYCYDEAVPSGTTACAATGVPTPTSGTPQHVAVTGSRGNVTTIASLVQGSTTLGQKFTYYDTGNVKTATDVNGAVTTFTYGSGISCGNSFATSVSEPLSLTRSMTWNCTGGVQLSAKDENSQIVSATYDDPYFWRPNAVSDQIPNTTSITYTGATSAETSLKFNGSLSTADTLISLDSLGRVHIAQVKESQSSSVYDGKETDYNVVGIPSRSTLPYAASGGTAASPTAPGVTATYDALGRTLETEDSGLGTTTYTYNQNDVLITSGPPPTGENAKSKQYEYDALGRLTSVCEITSATGSGSCGQTVAATGFLTKYSYDLNNNLIGVTQNAQSSTTQTRTYTYDDLSRLTSEINPESGTTSYVYDSNSTCGTSAADSGSLVQKTDAVGNVICYLHDTLRRLTSITYPSGAYAANTPNKYFVYDAATVNGVVMANSKARMAEAYTATSSTGTKITDLGYSYTVRGEVSDVYESTPHSSGYYHMNATYWANGALDQIGGLPSLPTLTYTPDGEGRPAIVTASAGQNPVLSTQYSTASLPPNMTLGSNDSDSFKFDPNTNRMTQFQFNVNSQSLTGVIGWNDLGTPSSLGITDQCNAADTQTCSFAHDDLVRIATVNCGPIWGQSFTYDAFGNITKTVLSGSSGTSFQPTYAIPSTNRIASLPSFTPTYDANGNLTKDPQHQYGWDSDGRTVTIDTIALTYDAFDRMVEQNNAGACTQIVYGPLGEKFGLMNGQTLNKAFAPLPDGGIAAYTASGLGYYRHPDWLGSSRLASTPTQTIYSDTAYAPFGEPYAQLGTADPSFTGQNQDTASNLYDFLFREDSPIQGRWISPDPAGLAAVSITDPQSWNRYAYVRDSPLIFIDSLGLSVKCKLQTGGIIDLPTARACQEWGGTVLDPWDPCAVPGSCTGSGGNGGAAAGGAGDGGGGGPANNKNAPPKCSSLGALGVLAAAISEASQLTGTGYILGVQGSVLAANGVGAEGGGSVSLVSDPAGNVGIAKSFFVTPSVGKRSSSFGVIVGGSTYGSLSGYSSSSNIFFTATGGGSGMNVGGTGTSNSSGLTTTAFVGVGGPGLSAGTYGFSNTKDVQPLCKQ